MPMATRRPLRSGDVLRSQTPQPLHAVQLQPRLPEDEDTLTIRLVCGLPCTLAGNRKRVGPARWHIDKSRDSGPSSATVEKACAFE